MRLEEMADMLGVQIEIYYSPGAVGPWIAHFRKPYGQVFYKTDHEDIMARDGFGNGPSPSDALANFARRLVNGDYGLIVVENSKRERHTVRIPSEVLP